MNKLIRNAALLGLLGFSTLALSDVELTFPADGEVLTAGEGLTLTAEVVDIADVVSVSFYAGDFLIGTDDTAPYSIDVDGAGVIAGDFLLTAVAIDAAGVETTSPINSVTVNPSPTDNIPPTVSLTSPIDGAAFEAGATITMTADAADEDGTIATVEFYAADVLLGTATEAPYTIDVDPTLLVPGVYELSARATDDDGVLTFSVANTITITSPDNVAPTVTLTFPADGEELIAGEDITLTADATDEDGTIASVSFYAGDFFIGTDETAPYSVDVDGAGVVLGDYELTAVAVDDLGAETTSAINNVTVTAEPGANIPPTVALTTPEDGASYVVGDMITMTADAADEDGTITQVEFYAADVLLGTATEAPYSIEVDPALLVAGEYEITARATDDDDAVTFSLVSTITVTDEPVGNVVPEVALTSPTDGAVYTIGDAIAINATASDADGTITSVSFFAGDTLLATDTEAPYSFTWADAEVGSYLVTAVATDNEDATTTTEAVNVTVETDIVTPGAPPADAILCATEGGTCVLPADTTATVWYGAEGGWVSLSDITGSIDCNNIVFGDPIVGFAKSCLYLVDGSVSPNNPPVVGITAPVAGATYTVGDAIEITATASDEDGTVASVAFYAGDTLLGTDAAAPYAFTWADAAAGSYAITAVATDDDGDATTSTVVDVTVEAAPVPNVPPVVGITAPLAGATYTVGDAIEITATASDEDGTVASVAFYAGDTLLGTDAAAPYAFTWADAAAGSYAITAVATDDDGDATTSTAVDVTVEAAPVPNVSPVVGITAPAEGATYTVGDAIEITAIASDEDGTVASVAFYAGDTLLGTDAAAPYAFTWADAAAGSYAITAVATDDDGDTTTSTVGNVTVNQPPFVGVIYSDDFEGASNWTKNPSNTDTATTGKWEQANPERTAYFSTTLQLGDTVSGKNALVTEGSAGFNIGTNDVDNGVTSIRSPEIDLPETSASIELSFSYYLAHLNNATNADFLRVTVVGDNASQVVFEVLGQSRNLSAAWKQATANLDAFAGQTVYLLVETADAGTPSLIEAAIDDVLIEAQ